MVQLNDLKQKQLKRKYFKVLSNIQDPIYNMPYLEDIVEMAHLNEKSIKSASLRQTPSSLLQTDLDRLCC